MYLAGKLLIVFGTGVFLILVAQTHKTCNKFKRWQSSLCDPSQRVFRRPCNMMLPVPQLSDLQDCTFEFEKNTTGCRNKQFPQAQDKHNLHNFKLNIYRYNYHYVLPALNISITNVQWTDLEMKLKPANDDAAVCISFRIKKGIHLLTNWHLFYDCPLYGEWIKETPFTLEYMARLEEDYEIKKFSFITPAPAKLDPCLKTVHSRGTLVYLDISFFPDVILHIQSLPARFKVTEYEVKRCSHIDDCVPYLTIEEQDKHGHISVSINIASEYGSFFFAVFAKSGKCNNGSCYISHTTLLTMPDRNYWNILMWFFSGLLLLLALLLISLHWRKWIIKLLRVDTPDTLRPTMLIIHEPLHEAHINVVELLVQFLEQYCYIRIHLDIRDIRLHHEDPVTWYSNAISSAEFVAIVSSPSCKKESHAIYQDLYTVGLRLVEEVICNKKERVEIFTILLPYCDKISIPPIVRHFKCFQLRKDFNEMIYFIHKNTHSQSMISRYVLFNVIKNNFKVHGWNVARSIVKSETIFEQNGVIESVQELQLEIPVSIIPTPIEEKELLQDDLDGSSVSEQYCFEDCIFLVRISDLDLLGENSSIDSSEEQ